MRATARIAGAGLCAVLLVLAEGAAASAEDVGNTSTSTVRVSSGQTVSQGAAGFDSTGTQATSRTDTNETPAGPANLSTVAAGAGPSLTFRPIPFNQVPGGPQATSGGLIVNSPLATRSACPLGQTGYFVYDPAGAFVSIVCVPAQTAVPPQAGTASPIQLAEQASARQPWPALRVAANPDVGLTGLPSWFWCAGSAGMPDATASSGPLTVTVRATLVDVAWDFGDGAQATLGLGQPFPAESDVQHVYQTSSLGRDGGYTVTASPRWRVTYSVNGGPFADLGFKALAYSRPYLVNQLQPQAVSVP